MQKILYLLLLVSVASFGQSEKRKPYGATCFTLNDSTSIFKLIGFEDEIKIKRYQYGDNRFNLQKESNLPPVTVVQEIIEQSDSGTIKVYAERATENMFSYYKNTSIIKTITTIGNHYEAYQLDISTKAEMMDVLLRMYFVKNKNYIITLFLEMLPNKDSTHYLQEFNKLVKTIQFK
jgi:hypothetical protein